MSGSVNQQAIDWLALVEVAINMYQRGVTNPQPVPLPQPGPLPGRWTIVKNIDAEAVAGFFSQKEFIGYVAQSEIDPSRYAFVLHGSEGIADFLDDFEFLKTDFTMVPNGGKTEYGFTRFYESLSFVDPVSQSSQTLTAYLASLNPSDSYTVVGHSLGAALATLHAVVLASMDIPVEAAWLFASPMVGDSTFVNTYNSLVRTSYRIVNKPDIVPQLPGTLLGYEHVNQLVEINSLDYPEIKRSVGCFHSPDVYIYSLGDTSQGLGACKASPAGGQPEQ